ncbi:hypothetical protein Tco_0207581, partial [Tanacetum coccineum]
MDSLIMEDEHLDTIPKKEESSVENLVPIPSESEDFSDIKSECDVPDIPKEIYSNPLFDEEIISTKTDSLLEEFSGELTQINLLPPGINEADFDPKEGIRLVEKLLYDNSSPRPPEDFHANLNTIIESLPTFPIPVEDSDSL